MKYGKFLSQTQSAGSDYIDYKSLKKALKDGTSRPERRDRLWADIARVDQSLAARELKLLSRVKVVIAEDAATHKGVRLRPDRTRGDDFLCGELQASEHTTGREIVLAGGYGQTDMDKYLQTDMDKYFPPIACCRRCSSTRS